jgi:hypothetical protein
LLYLKDNGLPFNLIVFKYIGGAQNNGGTPPKSNKIKDKIAMHLGFESSILYWHAKEN